MATPATDLAQAPGARRVGAAWWLPAPGESPVVAGDESCAVVLEGAVHNAGELSRTVPGRNGEFPNDAELVLAAYRAWGSSALERLRGAFAVAVWDGEDEVLLCTRDPIGIQPLFYAVGMSEASELILSTSVDALVGDPRVSSTVDRAVLADHLCHRWPDPGETYYEAVRRIPAGHVLRSDRAGRRLHRHWDPAPEDGEIDWVRADELERFDGLFARAVERCLGDGPVGIFLSGGLDSVSVAGLATDISRRLGLASPRALSLVFPDPECNEEAVQTSVARELGIPQELVAFDDAIGSDGHLLNALELSSRRSAPLVSYWAPAYLHLARLGAERGCRAILTGHGGDEWLTVTPLYAPDLLRSLDFPGLARLAASHQRSFRVTPFQAWRSVLWTLGARVILRWLAGRAVRATAPSALQAYRRASVRRTTPSWVAPDPALARDIARRGQEWWPAQLTGSWYVREMRTALDHPLVALEMEEVVENGRATGVRAFSPFLDADLVDFLLRTPPDLLSQQGRSKGLVRESLARRFPDLGFERQRKVAATSYARSIMRDQTAGAWRRYGGVPALAELGVIDPRQFARDVIDRPDKSFLDHFHMWDALNLEAWLRPRA